MSHIQDSLRFKLVKSSDHITPIKSETVKKISAHAEEVSTEWNTEKNIPIKRNILIRFLLQLSQGFVKIAEKIFPDSWFKEKINPNEKMEANEKLEAKAGKKIKTENVHVHFNDDLIETGGSKILERKDEFLADIKDIVKIKDKTGTFSIDNINNMNDDILEYIAEYKESIVVINKVSFKNQFMRLKLNTLHKLVKILPSKYISSFKKMANNKFAMYLFDTCKKNAISTFSEGSNRQSFEEIFAAEKSSLIGNDKKLEGKIRLYEMKNFLNLKEIKKLFKKEINKPENSLENILKYDIEPIKKSSIENEFLSEQGKIENNINHNVFDGKHGIRGLSFLLKILVSDLSDEEKREGIKAGKAMKQVYAGSLSIDEIDNKLKTMLAEKAEKIWDNIKTDCLESKSIEKEALKESLYDSVLVAEAEQNSITKSEAELNSESVMEAETKQIKNQE